MAYAKLDEFISFVKNNGFVQSSHFHVIIGGAPAGEINNRDVMMLCESTSLPGLNLFTNEVRTFGENRETVYSIGYGALNMSFLMDSSMVVRQYFEDWANVGFNRSTREVGYYRDFVRDVEIYVTNKEGNVVYAMQLFECFPKTLGEISLDHNSKDILRQQVTLQFKHWENKFAGNFNNRRKTVNDLTPLVTRAISSGNVETVLANGIDLGNPAQGLRLPSSVSTIGQRLSSVGISLGSDISRVSNSTSASIFASGLPSALGSNIKTLGNNFSSFGVGIDQLGRGLAQITAPVQAISNTIGSVAGTMNAIDSTLNALGLGTPLSGVASKLNTVSSQIAVVTQLKGIPGHLSTIGSTMTSTSSLMNDIGKAMNSIPEATAQVKEGFAKMGAAFGTQGGNLTNASSELASAVDQNVVQ